LKRKDHIAEEVPEGNQKRSRGFGCVKVHTLFFFGKLINNEAIDSQTDHRYTEELHELLYHIRVVILKCPEPIEQIITKNCSQKTRTIGYIFIQIEFLFQNPSDTKIYENARKTDDPKF
jgi:hypothetical protein